VTDLLRAAILGVIEGLTEFLPVSSTGHMVLAMPWLGVDGQADPWQAFLYFIQIGAILAVIIYFFRRLWRQTFRPRSKGLRNHVVTKLVVGMIPGGVVGLSLNDVMEKYLEWDVPVAIALILGAVVMIVIERRYRRVEGPAIEEVTLRQAFVVGLAQCAAVVPGTSRSMATIMGGLWVGLPAATAAEFSFYLAIPTICGAGLLRIIKHPAAFAGDNVTIMVVGFVVAFVVAWLTVAGFMRYIQRRSLEPFAIYRVILGAAVLMHWWLER